MPDKEKDEPDSSDPIKVLVVDDDPALRKIMTLQLQKLGLTVDSAANGVEALQRILNSRYELIFMDIQMPHMNGLEATATIRLHERTEGLSPVPIVATTGSGASRQTCLEAGMTVFLQKPVTPTTLEAVVKMLLKT